MPIFTRANADGLRNNYQDTTLNHKKNIESALFSIDEVKNLISKLSTNPEATHLKVFLVLKEDGYIDMCMTGSKEGTAPAEQMQNGKSEIDADLNGDGAPEVLLSDLPCPPHCGQGNGGTSVNGLDSKYISG